MYFDQKLAIIIAFFHASGSVKNGNGSYFGVYQPFSGEANMLGIKESDSR